MDASSSCCWPLWGGARRTKDRKARSGWQGAQARLAAATGRGEGFGAAGCWCWCVGCLLAWKMRLWVESMCDVNVEEWRFAERTTLEGSRAWPSTACPPQGHAGTRATRGIRLVGGGAVAGVCLLPRLCVTRRATTRESRQATRRLLPAAHGPASEPSHAPMDVASKRRRVAPPFWPFVATPSTPRLTPFPPLCTLTGTRAGLALVGSFCLFFLASPKATTTRQRAEPRRSTSLSNQPATAPQQQ